MANIIRSAKSGSDWTSSELYGYNIRVDIQDILAFSGLPALPPPTVDPELLQIQDANLMTNDRNAELIILLDLAMVPGSQESQVVDFAVELFKTLGYVKRHRVGLHSQGHPLSHLWRMETRENGRLHCRPLSGRHLAARPRRQAIRHNRSHH